MEPNPITKVLSTLALLLIPLGGCGDDAEGSGGSAAPTSASSTTTTSSTTSSVTSASTAATGGATPLVAADLAGSWSSTACEAYPDGMGGTSYLTRDFTFTGATWTLDLDLFGDAACSVPLFSAAIEGPFSLGGLSAVVEGATEGEFGIAENVWTAHDASLADVFTGAGCGAEPWQVGVPQDVSETGCIGVAHPKSECPQEYDIVSIQVDELFFGARVTDLCTEAGRPTMLAPFPVTKEP